MSAPTMSAVPTRSKMDTKTITSLAMLTGVSVIIAWMSKLMPPVMFLDFDFKHVVVCIGGFTFGPFAAAIIAILSSFIEMLTFSHTGPWGFLMNALGTASFCCTASWFYQKKRTKQGAVIGLGLGLVVMVAVMLLWNYFITPLYMTGAGGELVTRAQVAAMLPTLFFPFNLAKGGMNMAATLLLYKPVVTALRRSGLAPPSKSGQDKKLSLGFLLFSLALLATFVTYALVLAGTL